MDSWKMAVLYGVVLLLLIAGVAYAVCGLTAALMVLAGAIPVSVASAYATMMLLGEPREENPELQDD